ncbi:unnamed protein product [Victoria cruziana]
MKKKNPSAGVERKGHGTVDLGRELGDATGPPHASPATNLAPRNSVELVKARTLEKKTVAETTVTMGQDRDDQLMMFRKCTGNHNHGNEHNFSRTKCYKRRCTRQMMTTNMKLDQAGGHVLVQKLAEFQEPCNVTFSSRMMKRKGGHFAPLHAETDKMSDLKGLVCGRFSERWSKKGDAVAPPRRMMGEECMQSSFRERTAGNFEMNAEDQQPVVERWLSSRNIEFDDAESVACSVGSCSTSKPWNALRQQSKRYHSKGMKFEAYALASNILMITVVWLALISRLFEPVILRHQKSRFMWLRRQLKDPVSEDMTTARQTKTLFPSFSPV